MPRFFVTDKDIADSSVLISGGDAFHIARSLRMAAGDLIDVSDGNGTEYRCRLIKIRDDECVAEIESRQRSNREPPVEITLFMAMPKGDKLETIVQKAVELGASRIIPFESERCIKRPAPEKLARLTERLNKIAHEAAKQCGRARLPEVATMIKLSEMCKMLNSFELALFCYEAEGTRPLREVIEECELPRTAAAIVGSEGGFSPAEAAAIIDTGAVAVGLGPRILRCETAPDYVLSALSYRFEM